MVSACVIGSECRVSGSAGAERGRDPQPRMKRLFSSLYLQVLVAIVLGVLLGVFAPDCAVPRS